jgi:hypothetical protein
LPVLPLQWSHMHSRHYAMPRYVRTIRSTVCCMENVVFESHHVSPFRWNLCLSRSKEQLQLFPMSHLPIRCKYLLVLHIAQEESTISSTCIQRLVEAHQTDITWLVNALVTSNLFDTMAWFYLLTCHLRFFLYSLCVGVAMS